MSRSNLFTFATVVTAGNFTIVYLFKCIDICYELIESEIGVAEPILYFRLKQLTSIFFSILCHCSTFWLITTGNGYCKCNKVKSKCHSVNTKNSLKFYFVFINSHPLNTPFRNSNGCQTKINKAQNYDR